MIVLLSTPFFQDPGNGNRHRTPLPKKLRKIKRISFKAFLYLKGLLKDFRRTAPSSGIRPKNLRRNASRIDDLDAGIYPTRPENSQMTIADDEPTPIHNTRHSRFWQWRRVAEWERYLNDPLEKTKGPMIT
jgi:hypothetical protein